MTTQGWITRGVVLQTFFADEDQRDEESAPNPNQRLILCDVRTYGRYSRILPRVPVLQRTQGLHDLDITIPRKARVNLQGSALNTEGVQATPAQSMDGDHVLVTFLDNDPQQPRILPFTEGHPASAARPVAAEGRVRVIRHQGTSLSWDQEGNFTLDATTVAAEELAADGSEVAAPGKGTITFKNKDAAGGLLSIVMDASTTPGKILLGSDPATAAAEPFVCGSLYESLLNDLITAILAHTHTAPSGATGTPLNTTDFESLDPAGTLSEFIFGKQAQ
jgi:hypothetical protein